VVAGGVWVGAFGFGCCSVAGGVAGGGVVAGAGVTSGTGGAGSFFWQPLMTATVAIKAQASLPAK
jgi:hypothetical protein